jgi:hypothetical protein
VAFQRRKPEIIDVKAPLPASSNRLWPHQSRRFRPESAGLTKLSSTAVQVLLANEAVKIFTHPGNDWTKRSRRSSRCLAHRAIAVIDGEIVVPADDGSTVSRSCRTGSRGSSNAIVLVAFDLLYLNGSRRPHDDQSGLLMFFNGNVHPGCVTQPRRRPRIERPEHRAFRIWHLIRQFPYDAPLPTRSTPLESERSKSKKSHRSFFHPPFE